MNKFRKMLALLLCFVLLTGAYGVYATDATSAQAPLTLRQAFRHTVMMKVGSDVALLYNRNERLTGGTPVLVDGVPFLPLDYTANSLLASSVLADEEYEKLFIVFDTKLYEFTAGDKEVFQDNNSMFLSVPPRMINDEMYVALSAFEEIFGKKTYFIDNSYLFITTEKDASDREYPLSEANMKDAIEAFSVVEQNNASPEIYVAPDGDDVNGDGTKNHPFATVVRAQKAVRAYKKEGMKSDIIVYLRGGYYDISEPIEFGRSDSGEGFFDVVYKAFPGETPKFRGGIEVNNWEKHKGNIYKSFAGKDMTIHALYENNAMLTKARHPNKTELDYEGFLRNLAYDSQYRTHVRFDLNEVPKIDDISSLEIYYWGGGGIMWDNGLSEVTDIDWDHGIIRMKNYIQDSNYYMKKNSFFYLQGALEFLDSPGEFFYSKADGYIYYWPTDDNIKGKEIHIGVTSSHIHIMGKDTEDTVNNLVFDGLDFSITRRVGDTFGGNGDVYGRPVDKNKETENDVGTPVVMENVENITIKNCKIHDTIGCGIYMYEAARNCLIYHNEISNLGASGIHIRSAVKDHYMDYINTLPKAERQYVSSKIPPITCEGNKIVNNYIHDGALFFGDANGIWVRHDGTDSNHYSYNNVDEFVHIGISYATGTGCDFIEYNDITHCSTGSEDTGVIYTLHTDAVDGVSIRNNHLHDNNAAVKALHAIYNDENSNGVKLEYNIVDRGNLLEPGLSRYTATATKGINTVTNNNVFANSPAAEYVTRIAAQSLMPPLHGNMKIDRNIIYNHGRLVAGSSAWRGGDELSSMDFNIYWNNGEDVTVYATKEMPFEEWLTFNEDGFDSHSLVSSPGFVDAENYDYRLRYDSPAHKMGIKNIIEENIGVNASFPYPKENDPVNQLFISEAGRYGNNSTINLRSGETTDTQVFVETNAGFAEDVSKGKITYQTDNPAVATVDAQGRITAVGAGVCKIKAVYTRSTYNASSFVYVIVDDVPKSIRLGYKPKAISIDEVGDFIPYLETEYGQLDISALENLQIVSDNEAVLKINRKGRYSALSEGTATITLSGTLGGHKVTNSYEISVEKYVFNSVQFAELQDHYQSGVTHTIPFAWTSKLGDPMTVTEAEVSATSSNEDVIEVVDVTPAGLTFKAKAIGISTVKVNVKKDGTLRAFSATLGVGGENQLAEGWSVSNYTNSNGFATMESDDKIHIVTNGENVYGTADDATFVWKKAPAGDYTVYVNLDEIAEGHSNTAAGLMIRASDTADADNVHYRIQGQKSLLMTYRNPLNMSTNYISMPSTTAPAKLKLTRQGNKITSYIYQNDEWQKTGECEILIGSDSIVGVAMYSQVSNEYRDAWFSGFKVVEGIE